MRTLGAILAGGQARRFGSDKAAALLAGRALIDHVAAALGPQVDAVMVVGRGGGVPDRPAPGLGPLGGLLGALEHGRAHGFDQVLAVPCDMPRLPGDLRSRLSPAPAFVAEHPVVGLWPVALAALLAERIAAGDRAVRAFADAAGARGVSLPGLPNINRPADLADLGG